MGGAAGGEGGVVIGRWYDDGWVEELESWEEVADLLRGEWDRVEHPAWGLSLARTEGLLAFDLRGQWRARHRRGLHRLGFRKLAVPRIEAWLWDVRPQLRTTDLSAFATAFEAVHGTERYAGGLRWLRTTLARDHLVREQALRVLRDVFRCEPGDLEVLHVEEEDGWEDEEDEAWPVAGG